MNWLILALTTLALTPADVPDPRDRDSWVADTAQVLSPRAEASLDRIAGDLNRDLGVEAAVATVSRVPGTPKEFAAALFEDWGIGEATADNGVLVLLVVEPGRIEIEPGYGLESVLTDGWLGTMQIESMLPHLERGEYGAGLAVGLEQIDARLRGRPDESQEGTRRAPATHDEGGSRLGAVAWLVIVLGSAFAAGVAAKGLVGRRRSGP